MRREGETDEKIIPETTIVTAYAGGGLLWVPTTVLSGYVRPCVTPYAVRGYCTPGPRAPDPGTLLMF